MPPPLQRRENSTSGMQRTLVEVIFLHNHHPLSLSFGTNLVQELRHVVDIVVDHNPGGFVRVVGFDFRQREGFHFRHVEEAGFGLFFSSTN